VAAKIICDLAHFSLRGGQHHSIIGRLVDLIWRPRLRETLLQVLQRV
jgi:hypothetical protein